MRGYMQGALGALFAYGAAWWGTGERAATSVDGAARAEQVTPQLVEPAAVQPMPSVVVQGPAPGVRTVVPAARATAVSPVLPVPAARALQRPGEYDPMAGIAALPSDLGPGGSAPSTQNALRQYAEYRQLAEASPQALVERVERYDPSPEQVAELRRVAAQLFNARPAGAEGESPWAQGGTRDGQGSIVHRTEQSVTRERSGR
jgi:hypothetical protein